MLTHPTSELSNVIGALVNICGKWLGSVTLKMFRYYVYVHFAWKGHPRNDLYCVRRDVKPYSLTHSLTWS